MITVITVVTGCDHRGHRGHPGPCANAVRLYSYTITLPQRIKLHAIFTSPYEVTSHFGRCCYFYHYHYDYSDPRSCFFQMVDRSWNVDTLNIIIQVALSYVQKSS